MLEKAMLIAYLPFFVILIGCLLCILCAVGRYFWALYALIAFISMCELVFGDASWAAYGLIALAFLAIYPFSNPGKPKE